MTITKAIEAYRHAAETLLLRAQMLEAAGPVDGRTAALHAQDANAIALLTETWAADDFLRSGADVQGTVRDLAEVFAGGGAA